MNITPLNTPAATSRPPLALLHGWGLDGRIWDGLLPHLVIQAPDLPLLRVDLPGYGGSRYSGEDAATVARQLTEQLPPGCTLAGWSLGGMLAQLAAIQTDSPIARLVLLGTTPSFVKREGFETGQAPALLATFTTGIRALPAAVVPRFATLINQGDSRARDINRLIKPLTQEPLPEKAGLLTGLAWLGELDLRSLAPSITQPALVIHGAKDGLIPYEAGQWLAEHLPHAELLTLPEAAHTPFLHDPAGCAAAMARFAATGSAQPLAAATTPIQAG